MVVLKNMDLDSKELVTAFSKLMGCSMSMDAAYKVKKYFDKMQQLDKAYRAEQKALVEKWTDKEEDGKPKMKKDDKDVVIGYDWIDESEANNAFKELAMKEHNLEIKPLLSFELKNVELTPVQWEAITPFIADPSNIHPMV